jgi:hypothetical protein
MHGQVAVEVRLRALMTDFGDLRSVGIARVFSGEVHNVRRRFDRVIAGKAQFRNEGAAEDLFPVIHIRHTPHHEVAALRVDIKSFVP